VVGFVVNTTLLQVALFTHFGEGIDLYHNPIKGQEFSQGNKVLLIELHLC
jgi:hypothetical protein